MKYRLFFYLVCLLHSSILVTSQVSDCSIETDVVIDTANEVCIETGINQVCYGNNDVNVSPYRDAEFEFNSPGDIAEVDNIQTLSLSSLDIENGQWGIAVMRLLANLNPSQSEDVTIVMFGDVEIENASGNQAVQVATANAYANVRRFPNSTSPIMDSVAIEGRIQVTGRLHDNTWVRVVNPQTNIDGWIFAILLDDIDFNSLDIVGTTESYFAPMQAFYFQSGTDINGCASVPRDGLIIQTPEGLRRVSLWVNEVTIDLMSGMNSTASILTEDDGSMSINILEGAAFVSSDTNGYIAVPGSSINVQQSADGESTTISYPTPTRIEIINDIPVNLLYREIELPEPADDDQIDVINNFTSSTTNDNIIYDCYGKYCNVSTDETSNKKDKDKRNNKNGTKKSKKSKSSKDS